MFDQTQIDAIIRRVRAALATADNAGTPEEAAAAAAKAQELMARYNLQMEEIRPTEASAYEKENYATAGRASWQRLLLSAVSYANFCRLVTYAGTKQHILVGEPVNITATRVMYEYLAATVKRLAIEGHDTWLQQQWGERPQALSHEQKNQRERWMDNFRHGAVAALESRLVRYRADFEAGQTATEVATLASPQTRQLAEALGKYKATPAVERIVQAILAQEPEIEAVERLTVELCDPEPLSEGAIEALLADILHSKRRRGEQAKKNTALVVVKDAALAAAVQRFFPEVKQWKAPDRSGTSGWSAGVEAGRRIPFRQQLAGAGERA